MSAGDDNDETYSKALTMAGLRHVSLRCSTRFCKPSPADVVLSCSNVTGRTTTSLKYLGGFAVSQFFLVLFFNTLSLRYCLHGQLLDQVSEGVVVLNSWQALEEGDVRACRRWRSRAVIGSRDGSRLDTQRHGDDASVD